MKATFGHPRPFQRNPALFISVPIVLTAALWSGPTRAELANCGAPFVSVSQIQGDEETSRYQGQELELEGTLSADFRGGDGSVGQLHAVFVQHNPGDGNPNTSDGVVVVVTPELQSTFALRAFEPGTHLRISGRVQEVEGETQVLADALTSCGTDDTPLPIEITLPVPAEAFEGMLVRITTALRLSAFDDLNEYGELTFVSGDLARAFTDRLSPDRAKFEAYEAAVNARTLLLDDGFDERYRTSDWERSSLRLGATLSSSLTGVVRPSTAQVNFRLEPTVSPLLSATVAPPSPPARDPKNTRVVSANLHNLFKDGGDAAACYPTHDASSCRGASSATERREHRQLVASELAALDADIIIAAEVQNDFGAVETPTWQLLVDDLNTNDARRCERYEAALPNVYLGGDAIAVAIAYCADRIEIRNLSWPSDEWLQSLAPDEQGYVGSGASRVPLLATFQRPETGFTLTVVANHWKSRSPGVLDATCTTLDADCDQKSGEGYWSASRARAARGLLKWLTTTADGSSHPVILAGDFNTYAMEAPIELLTNNGYLSLVKHAVPNDNFTYSYSSRIGYLDHMFVSRTAARHIVAFTALPGNTEGFGMAPASFSDHNPLVTDLLTDSKGVSDTCDCDSSHAQVGTLGDDILIGTPDDDILCGLAGNDVLLGLGGNDCFEPGFGDDWHVDSASVTTNGVEFEAPSPRSCVDSVD